MRTPTGAIAEVGLRGSLVQADGWTGLAETEPPVYVALLRLHLAVLHRALVTAGLPPTDANRRKWLTDGLPVAAIGSYLDRWSAHFDLFHPERPFAQVPSLRVIDETRDRLKPVSQICLGEASGNTPTLSSHALDGSPQPITPAEAARQLLAYLAFTPGGLVRVILGSVRGGPLANTAAVSVVGRTWAETLILNLHGPQSEDEDEDLPAWEQPVVTRERILLPARLATGPNDRYTRLARAVLLEPDEDGQVRWIRFAAGTALPEDTTQFDPMSAWRPKADGELTRLTFAEGRAIWRDLPALLPSPSTAREPLVLQRARALRTGPRVASAGAIEVVVAGLASDQAKLERWRMERHRLPDALSQSPSAVVTLKESIALAEEVAFILRQSARDVAAACLPTVGASLESLRQASGIVAKGPLMLQFYADVGTGMPALMSAVADTVRAEDSEASHAALRRRWHAHLMVAAGAAWRVATRTLGGSADVLIGRARHGARLDARLRQMLPGAADQPAPEARIACEPPIQGATHE